MKVLLFFGLLVSLLLSSANATSQPRDIDAVINLMIKDIDRDMNGDVTITEVTEFVKQFDINRDLMVSEREFTAIWDLKFNDLYADAYCIFHKMDPDNNGFWDLVEVPKLYDEMDHDNDGIVKDAEIVALLKEICLHP